MSEPQTEAGTFYLDQMPWEWQKGWKARESLVAPMTTWRGVCGHLWDRAVEDTDQCPRCRDRRILLAALDRAEAVVVAAQMLHDWDETQLMTYHDDDDPEWTKVRTKDWVRREFEAYEPFHTAVAAYEATPDA